MIRKFLKLYSHLSRRHSLFDKTEIRGLRWAKCSTQILPNLLYSMYYKKSTYRVFMMESTKSKQLLWDFLLKDHMISWVNLIGIKRPFCETKSDFWYSEIFFSVHFGDISKGYPLEKCQNHHLLFEKLFHISKWPIKAFLKINFNLTLLYEKCPKYGSRCGQ